MWEVQRGFDELGRPLRDITFCVVDLETTGASVKAGDRITEIGAVKVRGGEVLAEFQTFVDPGTPVPPEITALTGITDRLLYGAPRIESALPTFLEFAHGTVLVAHNAPFDTGFLKHACADAGWAWPKFEVVDTAVLARRVLSRDEAPNCRLGTLARLFQTETTPNHRALEDARATVEVLHGLFSRIGGLGVQTLEELQAYSAKVTDAQRRKRGLADRLPDKPGVYLFRDDRDRVLYVGMSRNLRRRVRTYFTSSEKRSKMGQMVNLAHHVQGIECATDTEAAIRELRLIAEHAPRFNRRSRRQRRLHYVVLTQEPWPRLSIVRRLPRGEPGIGPFGRKELALAALEAIQETFPVRTCTDRFGRVPTRSRCLAADLGTCLAPCEGSVTPETYAALIRRVSEAMTVGAVDVVDALSRRMTIESDLERFEVAATHRDRLSAFSTAAMRSSRLTSIRTCPELIAARRCDDGRWQVHVIRYGRLAAAGVIPVDASAPAYVEALRALAESTDERDERTTVEESETLLRWLESPGVRLVDVVGAWACPVIVDPGGPLVELAG
ncbi:DEDD exonuclease domain-containing protein [Nocardioides baekrokdamisoli]|nr:DEDD exonuclease domain-containing protein [Nocardioides baekrokdamisoli]